MEILTLSPELNSLLQAEAEQAGKTPAEIAEAWLRQHQ